MDTYIAIHYSLCSGHSHQILILVCMTFNRRTSWSTCLPNYISFSLAHLFFHWYARCPSKYSDLSLVLEVQERLCRISTRHKKVSFFEVPSNEHAHSLGCCSVSSGCITLECILTIDTAPSASQLTPRPAMAGECLSVTSSIIYAIKLSVTPWHSPFIIFIHNVCSYTV